MTKTTFTTVTPLPATISRETALSMLHDHLAMIDLAPTRDSRRRINPPPDATPEEYHCTWYEITDRVSYLPGVSNTSALSSKVTFKSCFHDLPLGVQIHVYAPAGLDIRQKWTVGGSMPGEPVQAVEIGFGVPVTGLYLREDVEMKCNFVMVKFVRKTFKDALATLVARLSVRAQLHEASEVNRRLTYDPNTLMAGAPMSPPMRSPSSYGSQSQQMSQGAPPHSSQVVQLQGKGQQVLQGGSPQLGYVGINDIPASSSGGVRPGHASMGYGMQQQQQQPQMQYAQYNPQNYAIAEADGGAAVPSPGFVGGQPKRSPLGGSFAGQQQQQPQQTQQTGQTHQAGHYQGQGTQGYATAQFGPVELE